MSEDKKLECTVGGLAYDMDEDESTRYEVYLDMKDGVHGVNKTPVLQIIEVHCHTVQGEITANRVNIDLFELMSDKPSSAITTE
tara:strand:- start:1025 stop:1276 length:252 start_codon:yes stop_codon:yes gene_type:complete